MSRNSPTFFAIRDAAYSIATKATVKTTSELVEAILLLVEENRTEQLEQDVEVIREMNSKFGALVMRDDAVLAMRERAKL